jgi:hypothetical protein
MTRLVNPHGGGELKPLLLEGAAREAELARAQIPAPRSRCPPAKPAT